MVSKIIIEIENRVEYEECKNMEISKANLHEMNIKWDYEISISNNKSDWKIWKFENIERFKKVKLFHIMDY